LEISGEQLVITAAGRALDEDILAIAAEVELHPSLRPSKQDEASTKQTQLQTQAQVMSGPKRAGEPKREELIAASAGSAEEEDILDLTAEVEFHECEEILELTAELEFHEVEDTLDLKAEPHLHSPLRSFKLDEAPVHQKQLQTQAQVTDSKCACEPKREEIIAAAAGSAEDEELGLTAEVELNEHNEMLELTAEPKIQEYEEILELTAELELHDGEDTFKAHSEFHSSLRSSKLDEAPTQVVSGPGRASQPTRDVIIVTPAGSVEDEDILDLTPELELYPSLSPPKRDEVQTNRTPTVSPKRVGEPRTEEMIAAPAGTPKDEGVLDLTPEFELHPSPRPSMRGEVRINRTQRAREPTREELIAAPAGSAEEEDILDLTPELEIRPSLRSSQRDEARINRTQRAREPTREEIIAAMRKFISDE
jgi:hypothetical protein